MDKMGKQIAVKEVAFSIHMSCHKKCICLGSSLLCFLDKLKLNECKVFERQRFLQHSIPTTKVLTNVTMHIWPALPYQLNAASTLDFECHFGAFKPKNGKREGK